MQETQFTNHLINETSPYLLQHAHNPVDWYPWGDEAFARARSENKPILLSIGYSACHWCHVMAHESFEDEEIAKLMNENFVNIKVDREERPDLDHIYMNAVQMMTHHGGWPMTVFLTPEGVPFYGGTYFPPRDRHNMPGFPRVLLSIADAYNERSDDIKETSRSILNELNRLSSSSGNEEPLSTALLDSAEVGISRNYDSINGGFGGAPKFPPAMTLEFLLRANARHGSKQALEVVEHTCLRMANGGIYDQLGGGFHRYSTDARWLVPHFEKMLYDNALLARLYLHHYQVSQSELSATTVRGILEYVLREMTGAEGGFYSTQDADSEGHEGKFFVWERDEIIEALGDSDGASFCAFYNVTAAGNFEGKNILHVTSTVEDVARQLKISDTELRESLTRGRKSLFELRERRVKPDRDEKILTAWNGLMLAAFAEAGLIMSQPDYTDAAKRNAAFLLANLRRDGLLLRTYKNGTAKLNGYLEDYAFLIEGLVTLYETTGEVGWLQESIQLADLMIEEFWDDENGGFYFTGKSHESLIVRAKDFFDNATPSGNSVAAIALLRLAVLTGGEKYRNLAVAILGEVASAALRYPAGFGYALSAADFHLSPVREVAIVASDPHELVRFLRQTWHQYLPNKVVAATVNDSPEAGMALPLLADRTLIDGQTTAYVCENYTCQRPATSLQDFADQLLQAPAI